ncbi:MAG: TolC family protein [Thermodesulfobacteriota bacterium]|nr:TolC family protein [Thermodesulfobacteriota bacterium]
MIRKFLIVFLFFTTSALSISLDDAITYALQNNSNIKLQEAEIELEKGLIKGAKSLYDPSIGIEFNYSDAIIPSTSAFAKNNVVNENVTYASLGLDGYLPTGTYYKIFNFEIDKTETDLGSSAISPRWDTDLKFTLGQNLLKDFGPKINNAKILIAQRNSKISKIELERVISKTILDVEKKYWNAVYSKKNYELSKLSLDLAIDLFKKNEVEVELGTLPKIALLQTKSEVALRETDLIKSENKYKEALDLLKISMSLPITEKIEVDSDVTMKASANLDPDKLDTIAIKNRPELKQGAILLENSNELADYYFNQLLPDFNVEATLGYTGLSGEKNSDYSSAILGQPKIASRYDGKFRDSINNLETLDNRYWSVGASISIPLNNNAAKGQYEEAIATKTQRLIELDKVLNSIKFEARKSYRQVASSIKEVKASELNISLHKQMLEIEKELFELGMSKTRDVLQAQRDLIKAETQYNKALTDYNVSLTSLDYSLGTLIKEKKIVLDD